MRGLGVWLVAAWLAGCGAGSSDAGRCAPSTERPCDCPQGQAGSSVCSEARLFGPCQCPAPVVDVVDVVEVPKETPGAPAEVPDAPPTFALGAPGWVGVPYAEVGQGLRPGGLEVAALGGLGSQGSLSVSVEGPFEVRGSLAPLGPDERRGLEVHFKPRGKGVAAGCGRARIEVDGWSAEVALGAYVGRAGLAQVPWRATEEGWQVVMPLPSAPFPDKRRPYTDDSVLIFVPAGFEGRDGVSTVLHVHGYHSRLREVTDRHLLQGQVARSGRDVVLVAPQGPFDAADMALGKLDGRGGLARLLEDVRAVLYRDGQVRCAAPGEVALTAHSGGYRGVANMIQYGGVKVGAVHLFDALYSWADVFAQFARGRGRRLRSSFTWRSATKDDNEQIQTALSASRTPWGEHFLDGELRRRRATIGVQRCGHDDTLRHQGSYARWLTVSGLAPSPWAPPELTHAVSADGRSAEVGWWEEMGGKRHHVVEGSVDGIAWEVLAETDEHRATVPTRPWLRVVAIDPVHGASWSSDRYGATGGRWLVVDGFDRSIDGAWQAHTHGFAAALGQALGAPFSTASGEAVSERLVKIEDFDHVLWFLGDDAQDEVPFDPWERRAIGRLLERGGKLIVTGANVAQVLGPDGLADRFGARLLDGDAQATHVQGRPLGVAYPVPSPDALDGAEVLLTYDGVEGAAAVGMGGQVVLVGFPLETLSAQDMGWALGELVGWLDGAR